ncbi:MAG: hypothetical protein HN353_12230 [Bdellovibrionales bacterium]|nr:hypothetical protein [Bdellovibrionales bacterium]MBT3526136.1 hypothetical protein [Bdellovibrionales bacterium]MBT7668328.1 hypothetical protein [Bdellovibrionales bacterium]MBT7768201.1 hypothetical protein [Bdellovibrionales bacterium]
MKAMCWTSGISLLFLLLVPAESWALSSDQQPEIRSSSFEFAGCPANSKCGEEYGKRYAGWRKLFATESSSAVKQLQKFKRRDGVPLTFWSQDTQNRSDQIFWDSPCQHHRTSDKKLYLSQMLFGRSFSLKRKAIIEQVLVVGSSGKITSYPRPRGMIPTHLDTKGRMRFIMEEGGVYFGLAITPAGAISITSANSAVRSSTDVKCTSQAINLFDREMKAQRDIYRGHTCRRIWQQQHHRWQTIIFGFSC